MDVKCLAEKLLEYVMNNHLVVRDPETILQALKISLVRITHLYFFMLKWDIYFLLIFPENMALLICMVVYFLWVVILWVCFIGRIYILSNSGKRTNLHTEDSFRSRIFISREFT